MTTWTQLCANNSTMRHVTIRFKMPGQEIDWSNPAIGKCIEPLTPAVGITWRIHDLNYSCADAPLPQSCEYQNIILQVQSSMLLGLRIIMWREDAPKLRSFNFYKCILNNIS